VLEAARGDINQEIMALRFDDTELFSSPVPYRVLADELARIEANTSMQCPVALPAQSFFKLYESGIR
jgi:hypothetical protein